MLQVFLQVFILRFVHARPIFEIPRRKQLPMLQPEYSEVDSFKGWFFV